MAQSLEAPAAHAVQPHVLEQRGIGEREGAMGAKLGRECRKSGDPWDETSLYSEGLGAIACTKR